MKTEQMICLIISQQSGRPLWWQPRIPAELENSVILNVVSSAESMAAVRLKAAAGRGFVKFKVVAL